MPIQFNCSQCQSVLQIPDEMAGKQCKCPSCDHVMPIPVASSEEDAFQDGSPYSVEQDVLSHDLSHDAASTDSAQPDLSPNPFQSPVATPDVADPYGELKPHRGETVLAFGVISLVASFFSCACCPFLVPLGVGFGLPAYLMGKNDLREMTENRRNPNGRSTTQAGMMCGMIGMVIGVLAVALVAFQILMAVANAG